MEMDTRVLKRMADVTLALDVAKNYRQSLTRIQLQKFIYLLDVVGILYDYFPSSDGHKTYKNGPYDPAIQNAVDSLSFRGFVEIKKISRMTGNRTFTEYNITKSGNDWLEMLSRENIFKKRIQAAKDIGIKINQRGWNKLVLLVYAEPTFASAKPHGHGLSLNVNNRLLDSTAKLINLLEEIIFTTNKKNTNSHSILLGAFFKYLDAYSE